jgi:hypothetical protein
MRPSLYVAVAKCATLLMRSTVIKYLYISISSLCVRVPLCVCVCVLVCLFVRKNTYIQRHMAACFQLLGQVRPRVSFLLNNENQGPVSLYLTVLVVDCSGAEQACGFSLLWIFAKAGLN